MNRLSARAPSLSFLLLIGTGIIWGTIGVAAKHLYDESDLDAVSVTWLRSLIASPICFVIAWHATGRKIFHLPRRDLGVMVLLGIMLIVYQFLYLAALSKIGVSAATLISLCGAPVFVVIISAIVLRDRMTTRTVVALTGALIGTALIVGWRDTGGSSTRDTILGVALATGCAVGVALHVFASRMIAGRQHALVPFAIGFPAGTLAFAPLALGRGFSLDLNLPAWTMLIYLAVGPSAIAYWMYQHGLQEVSATDASIVTLLEPLIAAVLAAWLFDERLGVLGWIGAALLIAAIAMLTLTAGSEPDSVTLAEVPL
jgi:DME family drug/metabolite transporter